MLKKKMHGCTSKTYATLRKLYFHLSNMADLYVAVKKERGVVCKGKGEKKRGWSKYCGWWISESRWEGIKQIFLEEIKLPENFASKLRAQSNLAFLLHLK